MTEQPETDRRDRCICGETACESELCDCDGAICPVDHAADKAQQPETEAHPTTTEWIGEVEECDGQWMFLGANTDRAAIEARLARLQKRVPLWADGTPVHRRIVRKTTTYTVATEETPR